MILNITATLSTVILLISLRDSLAEELAWAKKEITNISSSKIKVVLKGAYGNLERTKYFANGTIEIKIDLLNETNKPSAEIEAVYFYSTLGWKLYQDGRECPSTDSDIKDFQSRHFLTPPVRKLHKNSWAQLKFDAKKILAYARSGDELKDSYRVTGRSVLRIVTSEGNFDYELSLDVVVDEIPF